MIKGIELSTKEQNRLVAHILEVVNRLETLNREVKRATDERWRGVDAKFAQARAAPGGIRERDDLTQDFRLRRAANSHGSTKRAAKFLESLNLEGEQLGRHAGGFGDRLYKHLQKVYDLAHAEAERIVCSSGLAWTLLIDSTETISGDLASPVAVPGRGQRVTIPLRMNLDLYKFFGQRGYEGLLNLAMGIGGSSPNLSRVQLRAKPTIQTSMGPVTYPGTITIVDSEFRGQ